MNERKERDEKRWDARSISRHVNSSLEKREKDRAERARTPSTPPQRSSVARLGRLFFVNFFLLHLLVRQPLCRNHESVTFHKM